MDWSGDGIDKRSINHHEGFARISVVRRALGEKGAGRVVKPYYNEDGVTIYHGDCRDVLPGLTIENAVVIADPPYGQTSLDWDRWDGRWLVSIPNCIVSLWCFGSLRMFTDNAFDYRTAGWHLSQDLVWEKHNGSSFHSDRFRRVHESICHFYRGPWGSVPHYTPTTLDATKRTVRRKQRPPHMGRIDEGAYSSQDGGPRLMRSVIRVRSTHGEAEHPTQKPVEIIKPLIHYGSYGNSMVIAPFCGSGSEVVAAKQMSRRAIGIEIEERYCEIAAKRLSQGVLSLADPPEQGHASDVEPPDSGEALKPLPDTT